MPPKQDQKKESANELKRIRTYESDVQEIMQKGQISKATIAIAENAKQIKHEDEISKTPPVPIAPSRVFPVEPELPFGRQTPNYRFLFLIIGGALLLVGVGIALFFFMARSSSGRLILPKTTVPQESAIVIKENEKRTGVITTIQKTLKSISVPQSDIRTIPIKLGNASITTAEFFELLDATPPATLVRALSPEPLLGVYGFQGGQPFLLFDVLSYDHAFAGMLEWEEKLLEDIGPLFGISPGALSGGTGSTTAEILGNRIRIKDIILRNKDARAAFDSDGNILFLYAFTDKQTLVLTTGEDTLRAIQNKAVGGRLK